MIKKKIGILGGMGPESTAIFYLKVIQQCQKKYKARLDCDYPEIFIYNLPIPDVVEKFEQSKILPILVKGMKKLKLMGADFIVIPCNTVHYFFYDIKKQVSVHMINMIEETSKKVKLKNYKKVGLLATKNTIERKIYDKYFNKFGIQLIIPEEKEQKDITNIILNICEGKKLDDDKNKLINIIDNLRNMGAEAIVLGCTDIPLLINQKDTEVELFDTLDILAESTVKNLI